MAITGSVEERRIDGNYGEIFHEGHYQGDLIAFTGRISIERRQIQRAGTNSSVFRRGVIGREGSFVINKVDSRFEEKFIEYANLTTDERRAMRDSGVEAWPATEFIIKLDDPDSWGAERIAITGVRLWEIGIGFTAGDMVERDMPCTWTSEKVLGGIGRPGNKRGHAVATGATAAGSDGELVY
jgi:Phage tail tube protein